MAVEHPFKPLFKPGLNREIWTQLLDTYIDTEYQDGARGPHVFDCWGLTRDILLKGGIPKNIVPSFGQCRAANKQQMTKHYHDIKHFYSPESQPREASIVAAKCGRLLVHVGFVVPDGSQLAVLHTTQQFGGHTTPIHFFERQYSKVEYYHADNFLL